MSRGQLKRERGSLRRRPNVKYAIRLDNLPRKSESNIRGTLTSRMTRAKQANVSRSGANVKINRVRVFRSRVSNSRYRRTKRRISTSEGILSRLTPLRTTTTRHMNCRRRGTNKSGTIRANRRGNINGPTQRLHREIQIRRGISVITRYMANQRRLSRVSTPIYKRKDSRGPRGKCRPSD